MFFILSLNEWFRLDKANLKNKEAEHIRKTYCQIKAKLEDEHKTFENQLDEMEEEIKKFVAFSLHPLPSRYNHLN